MRINLDYICSFRPNVFHVDIVCISEINVTLSDLQFPSVWPMKQIFRLRREMLGSVPSAQNIISFCWMIVLFHDATDRWTPGTPTRTKVTITSRLAKLCSRFKTYCQLKWTVTCFVGQDSWTWCKLVCERYFNSFLSFVFVPCRIYLK